MKEIKVLGTGCPKCEKLSKTVEAAAKDLGIEFNLEKIKDIKRIMEFGVMLTPALVVDGHVKTAGKVPSRQEIQSMLK